MIGRNRVSPTEMESREDSLAEGEELAAYLTLDRGLKSIASTLRIVIGVSVLVVLSFIVAGVAYVHHDDQRRAEAIEDGERMIRGVCASIDDVTTSQTEALIAAASVDGEPPSPEVIEIYLTPIEEAIERCFAVIQSSNEDQ